jgi:hypothetical protein
MNPIALGLIVLGIVLLLYGISSLMKNKRTKGLVFSIAGLLVSATPFVVSYFLAR